MTESPRILLVDDDRQVIRFFKKTLQQSGYLVTAITSSKEALATIEKQRPDLLILDLNMPEPDGFELLKLERARFPYLRVLAISGYMDGALLDAARCCGAIATLEKPVTAHALTTKVRDVLGK